LPRPAGWPQGAVLSRAYEEDGALSFATVWADCGYASGN
jgi:hypothetical protein